MITSCSTPRRAQHSSSCRYHTSRGVRAASRDCFEGFTLIELLITVIILGILAALALPLLSPSTSDAQLSTLRANIAVLRNAIALYHVQHESVYPGAVMTNGSGNPNSNDNLRSSAFVDQLVQYTDATGKTSSTTSAAFPFGPYLVGSGLPRNLLAPDGVAPDSVVATDDAGPLVADGTTAWKVSVVTGQLIANQAASSSL